MPGKLKVWPAWREFKDTSRDDNYDTDYARVKQEIITQYGEHAIRKSWLRVCEDLKIVTDNLASQGSDAVPVFEMQEILDHGLSESQKERAKNTGCFIVRGVILEEDANSLFRDLKEFTTSNHGRINGWPADSPSMLNLYNSPTQIAVRTHPNQILLQQAFNELWHDASTETSAEPLSYTDAARIRPSGQAFLGLGPHIDAGSFARWADPNYRKVYDHIFSGSPELHDAYDLNLRKDANQYLYPSQAHSAVLRSFQGWTALTPTSAHCGTLMLYPNVSLCIAYLLLRPFFTPPIGTEAEIMDATKWTFDQDSAWFPGTFKEQSQLLSPSTHPHLRIKECLVHIPSMKAGDTVWWHTDVS
jgi:hypothetical protein